MREARDELVEAVSKAIGTGTPFNPGCSEEELAALEARIGVRLPGDYREFLRHHDGQRDPFALSFPPDQLVFLSAAEVADLWTELRGHADRSFFDRTEDGDRVRAVLYDEQRVPIAHNESGGAYLFLDGIPGPRGTHMQLVFNPNEAEVRVLAASISELFRCYLRLLAAGELKIVQKPPAYGHGYWFVTSDGSPVEFAQFVASSARLCA